MLFQMASLGCDLANSSAVRGQHIYKLIVGEVLQLRPVHAYIDIATLIATPTLVWLRLRVLIYLNICNLLV